MSLSVSQSCEEASRCTDVLMRESSLCFLPPGASEVKKDEPVVQEEDADDGEWIVQQTSRSRMQQVKESDALSQSRSNSQSPTPQSRSSIKP